MPECPHLWLWEVEGHEGKPPGHSDFQICKSSLTLLNADQVFFYTAVTGLFYPMTQLYLTLAWRTFGFLRYNMGTKHLFLQTWAILDYFPFRLPPELLGCFKKTWSYIQITSQITLRLFWLSCDPRLHDVFIKVKQSFHQFSNLFQQVSCKTGQLLPTAD